MSKFIWADKANAKQTGNKVAIGFDWEALKNQVESQALVTEKGKVFIETFPRSTPDRYGNNVNVTIFDPNSNDAVFAGLSEEDKAKALAALGKAESPS